MNQFSELEYNLESLGRFFFTKRKKLVLQSKGILFDLKNVIDKNDLNFHQLQQQKNKIEQELRGTILEVETLSKLNAEAKEALDCSEQENQLLEGKIAGLNIQLQESLELANRLKIIEQLLVGQKEPLKELLHFNRLVEVDFINSASKENTLSEEAEVFRELQEIQNELSIISNFSGIRGKSLVVLSGGFSSGKSQFLNSLSKGYHRNSGHNHLKVGATPTTAVPTYVQACDDSDSTNVVAYTCHGGNVLLSKEQFHQFTHNYISSVDFDIRTIMPYASIAYPMKIEAISDLSFVDTPGIDASGKGSTGNDKVATENFIKQANALLWFVSIKQSGTISNDDLVFLNEIQIENPKLPIYIVANQADCRTEVDIEDILDEFEDVLDDLGIEYKGISAYSSFTGEEYIYRSQSIFDFIKGANEQYNIKEDIVTRLNKNVFYKYYRAFDAELDKNKLIKQIVDNMSLSILSSTGSMELQEKIQPDIDKIKLLMSVKDIENIYRDFKKLHKDMVECIDNLFLKISNE